MKYRTIVIDPPWDLAKFNPKITKSYMKHNAELPYERMSDAEIQNFPINDFADEECDLFLWTTKAKIHIAFHILEKWGFHYANFMVWNKKSGICHHGIHSTLEFILHGYKKRNGLDWEKPVEVYFEAKRTSHSQKPDLFYASIVKVTNEPRIDIFARRRHYGFDAYGDQVETQIEIPLHLLACNQRSET